MILYFMYFEYISLFCLSQCALASTQLNDVLWLTLNYAGSVLSVSQTVSGICDPSLNLHTDALAEFNTDVFVKHTEMAPM